MTGQVLDYSVQNNEVIISGDDGIRYTCGGTDWPAGAAPSRGMRVDFDVQGTQAVSIYLLDTAPPASAAPVAAAAAPAARSSGATSPKSRMTAALLALLLGGFCAHKFYLGESYKRLLLLLIPLVGWSILAVLAVMDAIKLFTMTDDDFDTLYG